MIKNLYLNNSIGGYNNPANTTRMIVDSNTGKTGVIIQDPKEGQCYIELSNTVLEKVLFDKTSGIIINIWNKLDSISGLPADIISISSQLNDTTSGLQYLNETVNNIIENPTSGLISINNRINDPIYGLSGLYDSLMKRTERMLHYKGEVSAFPMNRAEIEQALAKLIEICPSITQEQKQQFIRERESNPGDIIQFIETGKQFIYENGIWNSFGINTYTKKEIDAKINQISGIVFVFKGVVDTIAELKAKIIGNKAGDIWHVTEKALQFVWAPDQPSDYPGLEGTHWIELGSSSTDIYNKIQYLSGNIDNLYNLHDENKQLIISVSGNIIEYVDNISANLSNVIKNTADILSAEYTSLYNQNYQLINNVSGNLINDYTNLYNQNYQLINNVSGNLTNVIKNTADILSTDYTELHKKDIHYKGTISSIQAYQHLDIHGKIKKFDLYVLTDGTDRAIIKTTDEIGDSQFIGVNAYDKEKTDLLLKDKFDVADAKYMSSYISSLVLSANNNDVHYKGVISEYDFWVKNQHIAGGYDIPTSGDLYLISSDKYNNYVAQIWDNDQSWKEISVSGFYNIPQIDSVVTNIDNKISSISSNVYNKTEIDKTVSGINQAIEYLDNTKVNIISGYSLILDTQIQRLSSVFNYDDTAVLSAINQNKIDIVQLNDCINDLYTVKADVEYVDEELAKKVDKVEGKSLILDTQIQRLSTVFNYDDTNITNDVKYISSFVSGLHNYDDTELRNSIEYLDVNKADKEQVETKADKIDVNYISSFVSGLYNYDDTEIKNNINYISGYVADLPNKIDYTYNAISIVSGQTLNESKSYTDNSLLSTFVWKGILPNVQQLIKRTLLAKVGDVYQISGGTEWYFNGEKWDRFGNPELINNRINQLSAIVEEKADKISTYTKEEVYTKIEVDNMISILTGQIQQLQQAINTFNQVK